MATEKLLQQLVINQVENKEVYNYLKNNNLINDDEIYLIDGEDVTVTPKLTEGVLIGEIGVGDNKYYLYAPESGDSISINPILTSGVKIGEITVDGIKKDIYAPDGAKYTAGTGINISNDNVISSTVDYSSELALKANLASPTFTGTPKAPTASQTANDTQIATTAFVKTAVAGIVDTAPEALNTLNELAAALGDDPNFAATVATQIGGKVDKVDGKGLSTNDYTTADKTKLDSIGTTYATKTELTDGLAGKLSTTGKAASATSADSATSATNATNIYSTASTSKAYVLGTTATGSSNKGTVYNSSVYTSGSVLYGAAWNDYAEFRQGIGDIEPGRVVCENGDDTLSVATERLQPGAEIVSDTFGFAIGETDTCKTPIAVSGRVLAYPYEDRGTYAPGDAVCAAPGGTVSKMTRDEIREYPERIVGTVSAIPSYETWGENDVPVNGRIWIKVK